MTGAAPVAFFVLAMLVGIAVTARLEDSAKPVIDAARTPAAR